MKRYLAIPLLAAISAASFVAGFSMARTNTAPTLQPLTLTIHTFAGTRTVQATYSAVTFGTAEDVSALAVEYRSDRIFCGTFEIIAIACAEIYP